MKPILRYPGSKAKLLPQISEYLPDCLRGNIYPCPKDYRYVEPFTGSGASLLSFIANANHDTQIWINDLDYSIYALWVSVLDHADKLCDYVDEIKPSVELFFKLKKQDGVASQDIVLDAAHKIALHRMSVSGFGAMSGSPIGGKSQEGTYKVDCRWSPCAIRLAIKQAHKVLSCFRDVKITNTACMNVLQDCRCSDFIYLDPPYYVQGNQLYRHGMNNAEHEELAKYLKLSCFDWLLSYDDCDTIRNLYESMSISQVSVKYSNAVQTGGSRPMRHELLIQSYH
jgi:DNA adenine methylase